MTLIAAQTCNSAGPRILGFDANNTMYVYIGNRDAVEAFDNAGDLVFSVTAANLRSALTSAGATVTFEFAHKCIPSITGDKLIWALGCQRGGGYATYVAISDTPTPGVPYTLDILSYGWQDTGGNVLQPDLIYELMTEAGDPSSIVVAASIGVNARAIYSIFPTTVNSEAGIYLGINPTTGLALPYPDQLCRYQREFTGTDAKILVGPCTWTTYDGGPSINFYIPTGWSGLPGYENIFDATVDDYPNGFVIRHKFGSVGFTSFEMTSFSVFNVAHFDIGDGEFEVINDKFVDLLGDPVVPFSDETKKLLDPATSGSAYTVWALQANYRPIQFDGTPGLLLLNCHDIGADIVTPARGVAAIRAFTYNPGTGIYRQIARIAGPVVEQGEGGFTFARVTPLPAASNLDLVARTDESYAGMANYADGLLYLGGRDADDGRGYELAWIAEFGPLYPRRVVNASVRIGR